MAASANGFPAMEQVASFQPIPLELERSEALAADQQAMKSAIFRRGSGGVLPEPAARGKTDSQSRCNSDSGEEWIGEAGDG